MARSTLTRWIVASVGKLDDPYLSEHQIDIIVDTILDRTQRAIERNSGDLSAIPDEDLALWLGNQLIELTPGTGWPSLYHRYSSRQQTLISRATVEADRRANLALANRHVRARERSRARRALRARRRKAV